jgi:predicted GNAT family acetyltransferase
MSQEPKILDNPEKSRFETTVEGHLAEVVYRLEDQQIVLVHTFVPEELAGRGIAGQLAETALNSARQRGLKVVAQCPYIAKYIQKHPEHQDLLA